VAVAQPVEPVLAEQEGVVLNAFWNAGSIPPGNSY
jgi:hypothetical protein